MTTSRDEARKAALRQKTKTPMPTQDPAVRIGNFSQVELGYTPELAWNESERCIKCKDPRCVPYCPVEIDIRAMMDAVKEENFAEAYRIVTNSNLFPAITGRVCPQESQCEMVCIKGVKGEPVGIGFIEKFLGDWARANGARPDSALPPWNGKRIGIIGSGPAGMSAAADLVRLGYKVRIYEALHRPGGVLIYGIPEFRLPKAIVDYEIDNLRALGVEIVTNTLVGRTITMDELLSEFDSIFIGTGAGLPYFMNIPGEQLSGVYSANEFLTRANLMNARSFPEAPTPIHVGRRLGFVGGGNVAMDSARVAKRLGAEEVDVLYRRTRDEMPARRDEIHHAEEEGINFLFLHAPVAIHGDENGWVHEVELIKMELGEPDDSGRRRPVVIPGSNFRRPYDTLVMAIGQGPNPLLAKLTPYLKTNRWGQLLVDAKSLALEGAAKPARVEPDAAFGADAAGSDGGSSVKAAAGATPAASDGGSSVKAPAGAAPAASDGGARAKAAGDGHESAPAAQAAARRDLAADFPPVLCAGGDIIGSQAGAGGTVIAAMGHGKIAARTIHELLASRPPRHAPDA